MFHVEVSQVRLERKIDSEVIVEVESPINFCPFRFIKCVQVFIFIQIANLYRSYRNLCLHLNENENLNTLNKPERTEIIGGFHLSNII